MILSCLLLIVVDLTPFFWVGRDVEKFRDGIAEKVSRLLCLIAMSVFGLIMTFAYGWKLTLAMISYVPIAIGTTMVFGKVSDFMMIRYPDTVFIRYIYRYKQN